DTNLQVPCNFFKSPAVASPPGARAANTATTSATTPRCMRKFIALPLDALERHHRFALVAEILGALARHELLLAVEFALHLGAEHHAERVAVDLINAQARALGRPALFRRQIDMPGLLARVQFDGPRGDLFLAQVRRQLVAINDHPELALLGPGFLVADL